jgi:hypothetical protein
MISNISAEQLRRAATIKDQIDSLQSELDRLLGSSTSSISNGRRTMSASARAKIAAAQKARWAKLNGKKTEKPAKTARGKKAKAAGKKSL